MLKRLFTATLLLSLSGSMAAIAAPPESVNTELQAEQQLERQHYPQAIELFQRAMQLYNAEHNHSSAADAEVGLAKAYLLSGDAARALPIFQKAVAATPQEKQLVGLLGMTYYQMQNYPEAEKALRDVVADWENLLSRPDQTDTDRITLANQKLHLYRLLQKTLIAQNKPEAALEIAELSRARALVELLVQRRKGGSFTSPRFSQLQQIAKTQNSTLVQYAIVGREMRVLNIEPRDETDLYIWVIPPSGRVTFRQVNLKQARVASLRQLVKSARETAIGARGRGIGIVANTGTRGRSSESELKQLHDLLIAPIAQALPTDPTAHVTFIPEGALQLVPFAALQDARNKFLIEQHTILVSPSIQVLSLTHQQRQRTGGRSALVVGNPTMPSIPASKDSPAEALPPLPGAEQEARAVAALLKTSLLTGDRATKRAIVQQMPQARLIHLATHGLLDLDSNLNEFGELTIAAPRTARDSGVFIGPGVIIGDNVTIGGVSSQIAAAREAVNKIEMPGAIALAPSPGDTGFLSAKEILTLTLNAELVVLSACDTGRGRIVGDGVVGLSRAFVAAGVPSVVVSLWSVPDAPTASLMMEFYQSLQKQPDKAQALRQAMLTTLKQYPDPRDWAAFTLIGEAE